MSFITCPTAEGAPTAGRATTIHISNLGAIQGGAGRGGPYIIVVDDHAGGQHKVDAKGATIDDHIVQDAQVLD